MRFERVFTTGDTDPFDTVRWGDFTSAEGQVCRVPLIWGQAACDLLAEKIFAPRPAAEDLKPQNGDGLPPPGWLRPQAAPAGAAAALESDLREVLHRVAGGLCHAAFRAGLFDDENSARIFYDELRHVMLHRIALPEIALLGSAGLGWAYGPAFARAYIPAERIAPLPDDFSAPALPYAALHVPQTAGEDVPRRLRILADIHALSQTAPLSAVISAAHAAAFQAVAAQDEEEIDALARALGRRLMHEAAGVVMEACDRDALRGFDPALNGRLSRAVRDMRAGGVPETVLRRAIDWAAQGYETLDLQGAEDDALPPRPNLRMVLSVPDDFIEAALTGHGFLLGAGGGGLRHADAAALWARFAETLWTSGQPEFFFEDSARGAAGGAADISTAQALVSVAGVEAPSATLNLAALGAGEGTAVLACAQIVQAARLMTVALDAALELPGLSPRSAARRPLVIGFCGLAGVLMSAGVAYDSEAARTLGAEAAALVSGAAHLASAEMADRLGAYDEYAAESQSRLAALRARMEALDGARGTAKGVMRRLPVLNAALSPDPAAAEILRACWQRAYAIGKEQGFRHAHLTGLATPLDMQALLGASCRDLSPEAATVRFEGFFGDAAAGEGLLYGKKLNPAVPRALRRLGYSARQIDDIHAYAVGHGTLLDAPAVNHKTLMAKGVSGEMLAAAENLLPAAQDLRYVFNRWTLGAGVEELPVGNADDILAALGFSEDDIDAASLHACGAMGLEGAPHLRPEHLDVFDGIAPSGRGIRRVPPEAQIAMQAAVEPFLCGAAALSLPLGHHTSVEEMQKLALLAWEKGVKRIALWREGSSLLHSAEMLPQKWETSLFAEEEDAAGIRLAPAGRRKSARR